MGLDGTNQRSRRLLGLLLDNFVSFHGRGVTYHSLGFGGLCADSCR